MLGYTTYLSWNFFCTLISVKCLILKIFSLFFCRKLRHIAGQLRLFEINQTKINRVVGLQSWTTKKRPKTSI